MSRDVSVVGVPTPLIQRSLSNPGFASYPVAVDTSAQVTVTGSATPHANGAWSQLLAATTAGTTWIAVIFNGTSQSGIDTRAMLDIGYGAAASEVVKISSIPVGFINVQLPQTLMFPIWCPPGTRIAARLHALIASETIVARVQTMREPGSSGFKAATFIDALGVDVANSKGNINLATSNTYGVIIAATTVPYRALVMVASGGTGLNFSTETTLYTLAVGPSGAEVPIGTLTFGTSNIETAWYESPPCIVPGHFPVGTRIAVKSATGRTHFDAIVYGVPYA